MQNFSNQDDAVSDNGGLYSREALEILADKLPWVTPDTIIMPPHQYIVESKLQSERDRQAFARVKDACAKDPAGWKAYFRAYQSRNRYLVLGKHRYWYSQIGPVRMLNRCDKNSEVETPEENSAYPKRFVSRHRGVTIENRVETLGDVSGNL